MTSTVVPVTSTVVPVTSTVVPVTSTVVPVTSTVVPVTSTVVPVTSTVVPMTSTVVPVTSTVVPVTSTVVPMTSTVVPMTSGAPQSDVFGAHICLISINDLVESISSSVKLFDDDCSVSPTIRSLNNAIQWQEELDQLGLRVNAWQMTT